MRTFKTLLQIGLILLLGSQPAAFASQTKDVNTIVAIANDSVITGYNLDQQVAFIKKQLAVHGDQLPPDNILKRQVLQQMIDTDVQVWAAKKSAIKITNSAVNQAIGKIAKEQKISTQSLYQKMKDEGLSIDGYRDQVRDQLYIHALIERDLVPRVVVTDSEVAAFKRSKTNQMHMNTEYKLSDILIALPDNASSSDVITAKNKAQKLLDSIKSGKTSFKKAALSSSNAENALEGGSLGWRKYSELPTPFADAVIHAKAGALLGPIRAPNGYHLLKLEDIRKEDKPLSDDQIRRALFTKKLFAMQQAWLAKLKAQSYIHIY